MSIRCLCYDDAKDIKLLMLVLLDWLLVLDANGHRDKMTKWQQCLLLSAVDVIDLPSGFFVRDSDPFPLLSQTRSFCFSFIVCRWERSPPPLFLQGFLRPSLWLFPARPCWQFSSVCVCICVKIFLPPLSLHRPSFLRFACRHEFAFETLAYRVTPCYFHWFNVIATYISPKRVRDKLFLKSNWVIWHPVKTLYCKDSVVSKYQDFSQTTLLHLPTDAVQLIKPRTDYVVLFDDQ